MPLNLGMERLDSAYRALRVPNVRSSVFKIEFSRIGCCLFCRRSRISIHSRIFVTIDLYSIAGSRHWILGWRIEHKSAEEQ
jgi:hypothetical protein